MGVLGFRHNKHCGKIIDTIIDAIDIEKSVYENFLDDISFHDNRHVTMRNYAGTCKGICSYNLVYNFLI